MNWEKIIFQKSKEVCKPLKYLNAPHGCKVLITYTYLLESKCATLLHIRFSTQLLEEHHFFHFRKFSFIAHLSCHSLVEHDKEKSTNYKHMEG
jgi:hypothetical protein